MEKDKESREESHARWNRATKRVLDAVGDDPDVHDSFDAVTVLSSALSAVCVSAQTEKQRAAVRVILRAVVENITRALDRPPAPPEA